MNLNLNPNSFKYRNYDYTIGRFMSVNPLAEKYVFQSPYVFSENKTISFREFEGLEAKIALWGEGQIGRTYYTQSHIYAFQARALRLRKFGYTAQMINTGELFLSRLEEATKKEGSIQRVVIFAHSGKTGIYLNDDEGFYIDDGFMGSWFNSSADVDDLVDKIENNEIKFEKNATIIFGSCNAGRDGGLAEEITRRTGVTTIAASGSVAPEKDNKGRETGRLKTFKKHKGDPEAAFYKIERVKVKHSF